MKIKENKKTKKIYSKSECVFGFSFIYLCMYVLFYDKITKMKKEFNILICSRSRIINLYLIVKIFLRVGDFVFIVLAIILRFYFILSPCLRRIVIYF